ncbi:lysozyme [Acidovorax sp. SUPP2825]|uniref:lysozyme n=1 Tax=Acidovorax sp. SUPP2825 TaxID=2920879 RepID=UPI0023DE5972|nr:lysozyme [Acidovorax sp. SUPP2825]GKS97319.1 lysozyme [Acidovorax sp. SUPP2825]
MSSYPINQAGVQLLHERETFVGHAYPDPYSPLGEALRSRNLWRRFLAAPIPIPDDIQHLSGAPWTIGWGFTLGVQQGDTMSMAEADTRLAIELQERADAVLGGCSVEPNENQLAAMVVLAYNIGTAGFLRSTVLAAHNRGDFQAAARAFRLWNKSRGKVSAGLEVRRLAESQLYLKPVSGGTLKSTEEPVELPQHVDSESRMTASTINRAGVAAGGTAAVATVAETARTINDIKTSADSLGAWLLPVLLLAVVGLCGYIVWQRIKVRREGWS